MKLKVLVPILLVLALALSSLLIWLGSSLKTALEEVEQAEILRFRSIQLADELRQSSDDLTRFARMYVQTANPIYIAFFSDVLDIRNGKVERPDGYEGVYWDIVLSGDKTSILERGEFPSIKDRMMELGFTYEEFDLLSHALSSSDDLTKIENEAFAAIDEAIAIMDDESHERKLLLDHAIQLLYSVEYLNAKAKIMKPISDFQVLVNERTAANFKAVQGRERIILGSTIAAIVGLFGLLTFLSLIIYQRVLIRTARLSTTAEKIAAGNLQIRSGVSGNDELGILGTSFDHMVSEVSRYVGLLSEAKDDMEKEKDRSEKLLLNILPVEIADELKEKGTVGAKGYDKVSILFTDFKEFTQISEHLSASELVEALNFCFEAFDGICDKYSIEKIKTIGDAYMAAGGLTEAFPESVKNTVLAGLEMAHFMIKHNQTRLQNGQPLFEMRVGIHTGPVVAGIVGVKKFQYDFWGDTVNTASRMESYGASGKVNISHDTYEMIKNDPHFNFHTRDKIVVKGKGEVGMYFVSYD